AWERSVWEIYNLIRAVTHPYPGAFTYYNGRKLYLWSAVFQERSCPSNARAPGYVVAVEEGNGVLVSAADGALRVTRMQFEGEEEMGADQLLKRYAITVGTRLGQQEQGDVGGGALERKGVSF
ncbi:MAG: hypothetical protein ACREP8_01955, partial [Candidatus Binatia bacterium]